MFDRDAVTGSVTSPDKHAETYHQYTKLMWPQEFGTEQPVSTSALTPRSLTDIVSGLK